MTTKNKMHMLDLRGGAISLRLGSAAENSDVDRLVAALRHVLPGLEITWRRCSALPWPEHSDLDPPDVDDVQIDLVASETES